MSDELNTPFSDKTFFGRIPELKKLVANILLGKHTLVVGKKGIGKTRLIEEAAAIVKGSIHHIELSPANLAREFNDVRIAHRLKEAWNFYSPTTMQLPLPLGEGRGEGISRSAARCSSPIKMIAVDFTDNKSNVMQEIIQQIYNFNDIQDADELFEFATLEDADDLTVTQTKLKVKAIPQLKDQMLKSIVTKNYRFFIDNLDSITPGLIDFLTELLKATTVIATATQLRNEQKLKPLYASFDKIELEQLDNSISREMITYLVDKYVEHSPDSERDFLINEVVRSSKGNPNLIKSMISQAHAEKFVTDNDIKDLRKHEDLEFINLGPAFSFLLGLITVVKILQIGLQNREAYILLSIFSFLAYLTIRVFRYFFLFRPQRKR
jgi:energy-coupling factor transporter ATP-binding protein EcfA2